MTDPTPADPRPRLLIPITINFAVRYVVLTGLAERIAASWQPVLGLTWDDPALEEALREAGLEVHRLPDAELGTEALGAMAATEAAFHHRLRSPSRAIDLRRGDLERPLAQRLRRRAARWRAERRALTRSEADRAGALATALQDDTNLAEHVDALRRLRIDAVCSVTPYAIQEALLLPAAQQLGLPLLTSVLSFDNLTTRPPLPVLFDRYLVWNRFNEAELLRGYPSLGADRIAVVGPAQFDFYGDPRWVIDAASWRARLGIDDGVPTVCFGAGPPSVAPHEPQYLAHLLEAIDDGRLPASTIVVLRRHPHDLPDRWRAYEAHPAVRSDDPGPVGSARRPGQAVMAPDQVIGLCSTLAHTDVHVSVSSTLTLDGAFFGKPQLGPAYDVEGGRRHQRRALDLYRREHFVPIVASGGLELANAPAELVAQVRSALDDPERLAPQRQAMLEALCTFTDHRSTERVAAEILAFASRVGAGEVPTGEDRGGRGARPAP